MSRPFGYPETNINAELEKLEAAAKYMQSLGAIDGFPGTVILEPILAVAVTPMEQFKAGLKEGPK